MKPLGIKPLLAIYVAAIGRTKYALTWKQLKRLKKEGCYIASHGFNHRFLNTKLLKSSPYLFKREIFLPKKILDKKLQMNVDTFVYPYGAYCSEAIRNIKKAGYKYGFTVKPGRAKNIDPKSYLINRYMLTKHNEKQLMLSLTKAKPIIIASKKKSPKIPKKILDKKIKRKIHIAKKKPSQKKTISSVRTNVKMNYNELIFINPKITENNRHEFESPGIYKYKLEILKPFGNKSNYDSEKDYNTYKKENKIEQDKKSKIKSFYQKLDSKYYIFRKNNIEKSGKLLKKIFSKLNIMRVNYKKDKKNQ